MKETIIHRIAIFALLFAFALCADAVPAKPGVMTITQPDGTTLSVVLRGDERHHCYFTEDGFPIVRQNGCFYYAQIDRTAQRIIPSPLRVSNIGDRSAAEASYISAAPRQEMLLLLERQAQVAHEAAINVPSRAPMRAQGGPGLFEGNNFPADGKRKAIVILVEYTDVKFTVDDPHGYFSRMLMEDGFSDYGGTGSCHDFFVQNSKGQFDPQFDLYGPVTLSHNRAYYGGNDWNGDDQRPEQMVIEACAQLDASVDFSEYDNNDDGYVDNIFIFYAGTGEASGGSPDTVWPHSWNISSACGTTYEHDGVEIDRYGCTNEWEGGRPDGIGTFVHEFSHVLGLPDLYATSYTSSFTPGSWSVLDYGPYNNDGCTPPNYGAFERYALGWMTPEELTGPANIKLKSIDNNEACIIKTGNDDEFFLFENRQQTGWDAYIPGHGMLVWHVDYDPWVWIRNTVNDSSTHQYVDIEEADGTQNEYTRDGDSFPGANGVTSFTDSTKPSMKSWNNTGQQKPITEITENGGIISFKVCGGLPDVTGVEITCITDITPLSAAAEWTADPHASGYLVTCYSKSYASDRETRIVAGDWQKKNVGDTLRVTIDGLQPLTEYFVEVFSTNGVDVSRPSEPMSFTTLEPTFDITAPVAIEATEVSDTSFTANWLPLDDATEYFVDVYETLPTGTAQVDVCDFTDGVKNLPEGWTSSSRTSYANAAYSGQAVPALRLSTDQAYVMSPEYPEDICAVSFWHRGSNVAEDNTIKVMALAGGQYVEIASVPVVNEAGGCVTEIDSVPEGVRSIRIVYDAPGKGAIAIDDITVSHSLKYDQAPVVHAVPAGPGLSLTVTGLEPTTKYVYTVTASDGELTSLSSNPIEVVTEASPTFDRLAPVALEATEVTETSFVANWLALDGAVEYFVSVYEILIPEEGGESIRKAVLEDVSAREELSMTVTGLSDDTEYVYHVTATDGELTSQASPDVLVTTLEYSSVDIMSAQAAVKIEGKRLHIAAQPHQSVLVCDEQGRILHRGVTDMDGNLTSYIPVSGNLIVRVGDKVIHISRY